MANKTTEKKKEPFVITEEMIDKATSYLAFTEKLEIVNELAESCIEAVKGIDGIATETQLPIPQLYKERCGAKQYFIMYYFLTKYLHIDIKADEWNDERFDYYAGSHIFNQLERFKSGNAEIKNKVFDILYDFKELKKMLDTEIFNLKESRNDTLNRIQDSISLYASPENIKQLTDLLQKTIGDIEIKQAEVKQKRATPKKAEPTESKK